MTLDNISFDSLVPKNSKFLAKEDVGEDGMILTISHFNTQMVKAPDTGIEEEKIVMNFSEKDIKPMVLNRTNSQLLKQVTGRSTPGEARGSQIVVYTDPSVAFGGRIIGGLRIKKLPGEPARPSARPAARAPSTPSPATVVAGDLPPDDEIPF